MRLRKKMNAEVSEDSDIEHRMKKYQLQPLMDFVFNVVNYRHF